MIFYRGIIENIIAQNPKHHETNQDVSLMQKVTVATPKPLRSTPNSTSLCLYFERRGLYLPLLLPPLYCSENKRGGVITFLKLRCCVRGGYYKINWFNERS